jgi:hypothetical protein
MKMMLFAEQETRRCTGRRKKSWQPAQCGGQA